MAVVFLLPVGVRVCVIPLPCGAAAAPFSAMGLTEMRNIALGKK
ncbi:hypothetical protein DVDV_2322 [Desulfovibrio sp. DV]|nr:hypothetical protein DVDV_2322 [Desulfovibrio sp. DV]